MKIVIEFGNKWQRAEVKQVKRDVEKCLKKLIERDYPVLYIE